MLTRQHQTETVTIVAGANKPEDGLAIGAFAGGIVHVPSSWTAASLGFYVSSSKNGDYQPLYDSSGSLVEVTASASKSFAFPAEVYGARWIKLWSQTSGSNVNQASDSELTIDLSG